MEFTGGMIWSSSAKGLQSRTTDLESGCAWVNLKSQEKSIWSSLEQIEIKSSLCKSPAARALADSGSSSANTFISGRIEDGEENIPLLLGNTGNFALSVC